MDVCRLIAGVGVLCFVLVGCGGGSDGASGNSAPVSEVPIDINILLENADLKRGQNLYLQCRACHSLEAGGMNKVGPNLHGLFGSKAAFAPGFTYSEVLTNADVVWTPATLDPWLARPSTFLPGNRMVFVGIRDPQDRANIIAFLQQETAVTTN